MESSLPVNKYNSIPAKKNIYICNASKASGEIMLDRISVLEELEFPFLNRQTF